MKELHHCTTVADLCLPLYYISFFILSLTAPHRGVEVVTLRMAIMHSKLYILAVLTNREGGGLGMDYVDLWW